VQCPKHKTVELKSVRISGELAAEECSTCEGVWISSNTYEQWQTQQPVPLHKSGFINFAIDFEPSSFDAKAGLCPECGSYLARARVNLRKPFYVERCSSCSGIWCDRGEWDILEKLELNAKIPQLFSSKWQAQMRELHQVQSERQSVIDKLGIELANRLFEFSDILEKHEHGSFAAAYIMRRFDKDRIPLESNLKPQSGNPAGKS
jgi:Zn-finger nucleic acid-binding protein